MGGFSNRWKFCRPFFQSLETPFPAGCIRFSEGDNVSGEKSFVHLHNHTAYSLLDGASPIEGSVDRALELGMHALAITDHGVLYGIAEFYKKAKAKGLKPIIGCETYIAFGDRREKDRRDDKKIANHFVLLAENEVGYYNLVRLISLSHLEGFYYRPRIDKQLLAQYHEGLIGLSACLQGEVSECIVRGKIDDAVRVAGEFADILGKDHFYLEMEDHGIPEQREVNRRMPEVAKRTGLGLVATNDSHYLRREDAEAHDVLLCLQTQSTFTDPKRMRYPSNQFYLKSPDEMWALFGQFPSALENTVEIARRCNVELKLGMEELHFPTFPLPAGVHTAKEYLILLGAEGLRKKYGLENLQHPKDGREKAIVDRFDYELRIIEKTGFLNYFLVVQDFINYAKRNGIPVGPGRGSGAGSLVAYALGITGIDPLYFELIFERFLNPERVSPPDFDIDFCQTRRGEVIDYVKKKYGAENVAQVVTFGTLGAKTVIRDIGRVLEIPLAECDKLAKLVPDDPKITLKKAMDQSPEFRQMAGSDPNAQRILKYAKVLEGLPRQPGMHAAGVVIGEKPLIEILPLGRDKSGEPITQFEKNNMEATGLLKMDFLGLRTLTIIQEAIQNIRATCGEEIDIDSIPQNDASTFEMLCRGDAVCVFQLESKGMRDLLRNLGPNSIQDLIALIALYRPGPMDMIPDFIARKHGKVRIEYDHPLLEPILKETYGVMVYQEQVQFAARALAGYSLGEGDILRRAMGKKKAEEMAKQRAKFIDGCKKTNNISDRQAGDIFDRIEKFAGYGFNKSHSAAYGVISYQTAYLKAHYPVEFMAANMTLEMGNAEKLQGMIAEALEMEIEVLPPCVNQSSVNFRPIGKDIRFGLAGVKNVGEAAVTALVQEREKNGPYKGLTDFCRRVDGKVANKKVLESLVTCGAFDFTRISRGRLFAGIDFAMNRAAAEQRDRQSGQTTLFSMFASTEIKTEQGDEELPDAPRWSEHAVLAGEKELLGFYISGHPLSAHEWTLNHFAQARVNAVAELASGMMTRVGGLVTQIKKRFTKKDQRPMASFKLEGLEGAVDVVVFPDAYETYGRFLQEDAAVMVCGMLDKADDVKLKAQELYDLAEAPDHFSRLVYIHIPEHRATPEVYAQLKKLFIAHAGNTEINICLVFPGGQKIFIDTAGTFRVRPNGKFVHAVNHLLGEDSVYVDVLAKTCLHEPRKKQWNNARRTEDAAV